MGGNRDGALETFVTTSRAAFAVALLLSSVGCSGGGGGGGGGGGSIPTEFEFLGYRTYGSDTVDAVALDAGNSLAYVAGTGFLDVLSVSDPLNPAFQGGSTIPAFPEDVTFAGTTAYVADSSSITVFDVADPLNPAFVTSLPRNPGPLGLSVVGDRLYSAEDSTGLVAWSLADPKAPLLLGTAGTSGTAYSVAIDGSFAYVGAGIDGMHAIELGDGSNMSIRGTLLPPADSVCGSQYLGCSGGHCLVSQCVADPQVVDVSNPDALNVAGTLDLELSTRRAWMGEGYGVITRGTLLLLVDLRNPSQPTILDDWDLAGLAEIDVRDIDVDGDLLAVAADSGFALLRLIRPSGGQAVP